MFVPCRYYGRSRGMDVPEMRGSSRLSNSQLNGRGHTAIESFGMDQDDRLSEMLKDPQVGYQVNPIQVLWRRLWVIVLVTCLVMGLAAGFTYMQPPTYQSSITILVGQDLNNGSPENLLNEVQGVASAVETVAVAINTTPVAKGVVEKLDLPGYSAASVLSGLGVEQVGTSQFITVSYTDTDPERAQLIANTVGDEFSEQIHDVTSGTTLTARVWEEAALPDSPVSPNPVRNISLAMVLGLMLGVGLAFLLDHLDDDWRSPEEVEGVAGVPTFGVIPMFKLRKNKKKRG